MPRDGCLIPLLGRLLPALKDWTTPLGLLKRAKWVERYDRQGVATDIFVLASVVVLTAWLALIDTYDGVWTSEWIRRVAVGLLAWRSYAIAVVTVSWILVEKELPNPNRAVLLFCLNLVELRLMLCLTAVLTAMIVPHRRWDLLLGSAEEGQLTPWLSSSYQLLSWVIVALAVAALAGYLREKQESRK